MNAIVKTKLDNKFGSVRELDVQLLSVRDDITSRFKNIAETITKLGDEVHATTSTLLGHVTKTKLPDLERLVADILNADGPTPLTPPDDIPTPLPVSMPTDPPPDLLPPHHRATPSRTPAPAHIDTNHTGSSPVDFERHNSHFGAGIDADGPTLSPTE